MTYRVYDYERRDAEGNLRELHLDQVIEVTTILHQDTVSSPTVEERKHIRTTTFVESEFFTVYKWDVQGKATFSFNDQYLLLSVVKGNGTLIHEGESYSLEKGMHFIVPVKFGEFELDGDCELIVSYT